VDSIQNPGYFLAGVAGLIRNSAGDYLMMKRVTDRDFGSEVWECVTGRVNQGEGFEEALHREVMEETGLRVNIETFIGLSHFYRGKEAPENELQGIILGCSVVGTDEIDHGPEHSEYRWASTQEALAFLTDTDPGTLWLRKTLLRAEAISSAQPEALAEVFGSDITIRADR